MIHSCVLLYCVLGTVMCGLIVVAGRGRVDNGRARSRPFFFVPVEFIMVGDCKRRSSLPPITFVQRAVLYSMALWVQHHVAA